MEYGLYHILFEQEIALFVEMLRVLLHKLSFTGEWIVVLEELMLTNFVEVVLQ